MATPKPTIILFPGAFHPASCLDPFTSRLTAAGYPNEAYTLPSVGDREIGVADDTAFFVSVMKPHIDAGKDVILIVHSYAGFPGTVSIHGLDKRAREARSEAGGVLGIVYLAAFVPFENETVYELLSRKWLWWMTDNLEAGLIDTHTQSECFYHDCKPEEATAVTATLKGHSTKAFNETPAAIGWRESGYDGRRAYIRCLQDKALLPFVQDLFINRSGVSWVVKDLDTSHSPFISAPDDLLKVTEEIAAEFYAAKS